MAATSPPPHCRLPPCSNITFHGPSSCSQATELFYTGSSRDMSLASAFSLEKWRHPTSETNTDYGAGRRPFPPNARFSSSAFSPRTPQAEPLPHLEVTLLGQALKHASAPRGAALGWEEDSSCHWPDYLGHNLTLLCKAKFKIPYWTLQRYIQL